MVQLAQIPKFLFIDEMNRGKLDILYYVILGKTRQGFIKSAFVHNRVHVLALE